MTTHILAAEPIDVRTVPRRGTLLTFNTWVTRAGLTLERMNFHQWLVTHQHAGEALEDWQWWAHFARFEADDLRDTQADALV